MDTTWCSSLRRKRDMNAITCLATAIVVSYRCFSVALGYNVDANHPIIYSSRTGHGDHFGYSVLLYSEPTSNYSWLFVGAPKANYSRERVKDRGDVREPGIAYRCRMNGTCEEIGPKDVRNEEGYISQLGTKTTIKKQESWFGSAMSIETTRKLLTICAPRTIVSIFNPSTEEYVDTMQGMCYNGLVSSDTVLIEDKDISNYDFRTRFWYNPLHGFSIHYPPPKIDRKGRIYRIIGEPKHEVYGTVDIAHGGLRRSIDLPTNDELSQFGYSVTSGYYFHRDRLLYASGAPGWQYVGQVGIIDPTSNSSIITKLHGDNIGDFFGATVATGDLNGDGFDDLLVGAPHWGYDAGKVYVYFGGTEEVFRAIGFLEGGVEEGQFGYSVVCGDLDADGLDDVIVGAPWEESGVIYVYNGRVLSRDGSLTGIEPTQRIPASNFALPGIERFGFSLSKPLDMDFNGYPDIAVGAYKSGHAILLRSRPVTRTNLTISTFPSTLQRDTSCFLMKICVRYKDSISSTEAIQNFTITTIIDERYKRTKQTSLCFTKESFQGESCVNTSITVSKNIQDFIEPITVNVRHDFVYNDSTSFCKTCFMEDKLSESNVARTLLPFDIGCGEDEICNSNITATTRFYGVRDTDTWIIGSDDVSLEVTLQNHAEPAYLTAIVFVLPPGIALCSVLPSCQESASSNVQSTVTCNVANPLDKEVRNVKLDLCMKNSVYDDGSADGRKLNFSIEIKTRSANHGTKQLTATLNLKSDVSLSLNGRVNEESYHFSNTGNEGLNISFRHTYQIVKFGVTPVTDAWLVVEVPVSATNGDSSVYTYMYKPQLYVSGEIRDCSSNIAFLETPDFEENVEKEVSADQFDLLNAQFTNHTRNEYEQKAAVRRFRRSVNESRQMSYTHMLIRGAGLLFSGKIGRPSDLYDSEVDISYFNCSTYGVICTNITCNVSGLKTSRDVGRLLLKLVLNATGLVGPNAARRKVLKLSTKAHIEVTQSTAFSHPGTRSAMQLTTIFYGTLKAQKVDLWIVIISISVGLLLLCLFVAILNTLGFFKRSRKEKLDALKTNDEIVVST